MKALLILLLATAFNQLVFGQIKITLIDKKNIPASIHYAGHIVNAARYTDKEGEHLIITAETGIVSTKGKDGDEFRKADLYAYNYVTKDGKLILSWQMHDFSGDCKEDPKAAYLPNSFAITDIDNNGIAEVWLMYATACRGDVSPASMKIIMHQGATKFAVRGENKVDIDSKTFVGGAYTFDEIFKKGPEIFRQYAAQLWKKNIMENWK